MEVRLLSREELPSPGFIRRPRPVYREFAEKMTWFSVIEFQPNGCEDMYYCWVSKDENREYERGHKRTRFCLTYRRKPRKILKCPVV